MHHLVVLDCEVVPCFLQVRDLHEVAGRQGLADVGVVVSRVEVRADQLDAHTSRNPHLRGRLRASALSHRQAAWYHSMTMIMMKVLMESTKHKAHSFAASIEHAAEAGQFWSRQQQRRLRAPVGCAQSRRP